MNKPLRITLIIIGSLIGTWLVLALIALISVNSFNEDSELSSAKPEYKGLAITRETYNKGCLSGASEEVHDFTNEQISLYCDCTYDKGVALYGVEKLTSELSKLGETDVFTEEFNTIINECVSENLF